jgi:hypothetical protein
MTIIPQRIKPARASLILDQTMTRAKVADELAQMIFSATRNYERTVRADKPTRDMIVRALRQGDRTAVPPSPPSPEPNLTDSTR